jgi:NADH dehydrogenase
MILVAGGTGTLGGRLVPRLTQQGAHVRILTRDPARAERYVGPRIEVIVGDVRDKASVNIAVKGADTVVSAVQGFVGAGGVSPESVDRDGNANLIDAACRTGAAFVLVSVVGASADHPIGLFRAKHAAEQTLQSSGLPWTIVRASAFVETWCRIMDDSLRTSGKLIVFGRGENPINFVSATEVATIVCQAATDPQLRGQVLEVGSPENLTFNQLAALLQEISGRHGRVRHIPRSALRAMASVAPVIRPQLARQARAAVAMDTLDMTFHRGPVLGPAPEPHPIPQRIAIQELFEEDRSSVQKAG